MRQDSTSIGLEFQLNTSFGCDSALCPQRSAGDDRGRRVPDIDAGDEGYLISNPGKGVTQVQFPTGATPLGQPTPRPNRTYDAFEIGYNRRFANNWFFSANYTISRLYGNYAGLASSDEYNTPTTGVSSSVGQQQAGTLARPGGNVNRAWDLDELLCDSHGNLDVLGRLGTDRPHVVKLYGAYQFHVRHADRRELLRRQRNTDFHLCDHDAQCGRFRRRSWRSSDVRRMYTTDGSAADPRACDGGQQAASFRAQRA